MNFDGATGWLVGEPNIGLNAMFTMMNGARLGVGVQGLALSEVAYQNRSPTPRTACRVARCRARNSRTAGRPDHCPSRYPAHTDEPACVQRRLPAHSCYGRVAERHRPSLSRRRGATGSRRSCRPVYAGHQRSAHRHRFRQYSAGPANLSADMDTSSSTAWSSSCAIVVSP